MLHEWIFEIIHKYCYHILIASITHMSIYMYVYADEHVYTSVYTDGGIQWFLNHSLIYFNRRCLTEFGVCELPTLTGQPAPGILPLVSAYLVLELQAVPHNSLFSCLVNI